MLEGKIVKALSGFYYVLSGDTIYQCRGRGVFRKRKITPLVGDYVSFQAENEVEGYIMDIKKRKNELLRPPIANVDQAILIFSAKEPDFNPMLLDRFLVIIETSNITPLICITKVDLMSEQDTKDLQPFLEVYRSIGYKLLLLSSKTSEGIEKIKPILADKTSVFAGQTGVGKTSLLNSLRPDLQLKTAEISDHLGRGRHTTRHVELMEIGGGLVADTPGFSSLDFRDIEAEQLSIGFPEIEHFSEGCKFRGCLHLNEPSCAIKTAVEKNDISPLRYKHYLYFLQEIRERKPRY